MPEILSWDNFRHDGRKFSQSLFVELKKIGLAVTFLECDHICFRVGSVDEYRDYKTFLEARGTLLSEAQVNGRPIATFRLADPFESPWGPIELIELPSPKPGKSYETGFEHCEFVIDVDFEAFRSRHPLLSFHVSPKALINSEMQLKTPAGQAKFHHLRLDRVIDIEDARIGDVIFDLEGTLIDNQGRQALVYPGIHAILKNLQDRGIRLHIWTARDTASCQRLLAELSLSDYFTSVSGASTFCGKPDPESLTWDWSAAPRNSVLMLGDTATDMTAARNVGAIAAGAVWERKFLGRPLNAAVAEILFETPEDFGRWIVGQLRIPA